jgi:hypothetical protein
MQQVPQAHFLLRSGYERTWRTIRPRRGEVERSIAGRKHLKSTSPGRGSRNRVASSPGVALSVTRDHKEPSSRRAILSHIDEVAAECRIPVSLLRLASPHGVERVAASWLWRRVLGLGRPRIVLGADSDLGPHPSCRLRPGHGGHSPRRPGVPQSLATRSPGRLGRRRWQRRCRRLWRPRVALAPAIRLPSAGSGRRG